MAKYFGTDGFRGKANVALTADHAYKIGRFVGWYFMRTNPAEKCKVVIGKDTRLSSYMFEHALTAGLTASGVDVYLMHVTTTASISYITNNGDFRCGIMITASHNGYTDNGIKILNCHGEKIDDTFVEQLEYYIDGNLVVDGIVLHNLPFATEERIGKVVDFVDGRVQYLDFLFSIANLQLDGMRIGIDTANGASWQIAQKHFERLGAKLFVLGANPNGTNVNKGVGSTHIERLQHFVRENNLQVGFAFDGDADRCLCVDENGKVVDGDLILYLCAKDMAQRGKLSKKTVVTTVMSNIGLYKALEKIGINYCKTAVGDRFVYEEMRSNGFQLGGEQSGHVIFGELENTGDGLVTATKVLQIMVEQNAPLSELVKDVKIFPQTLVNVAVHNKQKVVESEKLQQIVQKQNVLLDGNGRVLVRASGTEEVVRIMVEAETIELCHQVTKIVQSAIE